MLFTRHSKIFTLYYFLVAVKYVCTLIGVPEEQKLYSYTNKRRNSLSCISGINFLYNEARKELVTNHIFLVRAHV